jgi:hypothetical protein
LKKNRLVDDTGGQKKYKPIEVLKWSEQDLKVGKPIKIKTFPQNKKVKLFRGKRLYQLQRNMLPLTT